MNPIQAGFFSLSGGAQSGDDDAYLRWHALDHQPEQYAIAGIRLATRWRADDACVAARLVASDALAPVRHAVSYLLTDPLDATLTAFARLGRHAAEAGRFPDRATSHLLGAFRLLHAAAAPRVLVSTEAVPFRPHRGVLLLVEQIAASGPTADAEVAAWARWHHAEHVPSLLAAPGVAGVYAFRSSTVLGIGAAQGDRYGMPMWDPGNRFVTLAYLDDDVTATTAALAPLIEERWTSGAVVAELAGPFRSMVTHLAWPEP